jgi:AcrR family transcriptional regulator
VPAARPPDPARRNEQARRAIHTAARDLVAELGLARVSVESIAARAGVGKQTIYRWWPTKCAVVLDALVAENVPPEGPGPVPDTGDLAADLGSALRKSVSYMTDPANDNLLRAVTAEMQYDAGLAADVRDRLMRPQFDAIAERIRRAAPTGPDGRPVDPVVTAELLVGPVFHRWLLRTGPLDDGYLDCLVDQVLGHPSRTNLR